MKKLELRKDGVYYFTNVRHFKRIRFFHDVSVKKAFDFAYDMSFGGKGKHRDNRSGGDQHRKNGQIFANTFQGKLAEFGVYNEFNKIVTTMNVPDLEEYDLGVWDKYDFCADDKKIAVFR